ncbi:MAG: hypothetical protein ACM33B_15335 [Pseudomonadota bacterium]
MRWTDRGESDPGIVLLELLAFLAAGFLLAYWLSRRDDPRA